MGFKINGKSMGSDSIDLLLAPLALAYSGVPVPLLKKGVRGI